MKLIETTHSSRMFKGTTSQENNASSNLSLNLSANTKAYNS